ncbi:MAG TPA: MBOAT family protein [Bryobacteraceae bacterium]|nr:MBOAT family protein [Bryobacteraceae bacterium]
MLFSTIPYFVFFLITLSAFYLAPERLRKPVLLVASYFFYASWNWKFVPLLLTLTVIDYLAALWIEDRLGPSRKTALIISLAANLGFLFFFKYFNFAASSLATILGMPEHRFHFEIVLPLGISFHTFQSISYVVDVYRRQQRAIRKPLDYALFISFFPQLVAGPIVRAHDFFGDLYKWQTPDFEEIKRGTFLVVLGLVKKVALADNFAALVDPYFASVATQAGGLHAWAHVFAFAMQIFFDFSGYTDMAIGFALLLGFHFPVNFRRPYLAVSITDFWRRWHISLSTWLRDYLYIPLGGNRRGRVRTYWNLLLTMLLGGLWHGASWNFVIWGGYHGCLLALEKLTRQNKECLRPWSILDAPRTLLTFLLVCVGWVFFRATTLHDSISVIGALFHGQGSWDLDPVLMVLSVIALVIAIFEERIQLSARLQRAPLLAYGSALALLLLLVETFSPDAARNFIYFQF